MNQTNCHHSHITCLDDRRTNEMRPCSRLANDASMRKVFLEFRCMYIITINDLKKKNSTLQKDGGGRTSWEKEWFNSTNPFTTKTDFNREQMWPSPNNYRIKSTLANSSSIVYHQAPIHSIGIKLPTHAQNLNSFSSPPPLIETNNTTATAAAFLPTQANNNNNASNLNEPTQTESNRKMLIFLS
jgi:hypothetical protein